MVLEWIKPGFDAWYFFPKVGLPPLWGGTYKGARQGPLNGSNPIQDAACLCNTNEQTFLNFGLHCNSKCFDHNSESITKIKTEILESEHKSGIGLTTMISGSQNTKKFWNRPTGSRLMNFQRFKFFFFKFVVVSFVRFVLHCKQIVRLEQRCRCSTLAVEVVVVVMLWFKKFLI